MDRFRVRRDVGKFLDRLGRSRGGDFEIRFSRAAKGVAGGDDAMRRRSRRQIDDRRADDRSTTLEARPRIEPDVVTKTGQHIGGDDHALLDGRRRRSEFHARDRSYALAIQPDIRSLKDIAGVRHRDVQPELVPRTTPVRA